MAALMRHGTFKIPSKNIVPFALSFATKAEKKKGLDRKQPPKIDSKAESIAAKGFVRSQKAYTVPNNAKEKLQAIFQKVIGDSDDTTAIQLSKKFELCNLCAMEFQHSIPNSLLHTIDTLGDVQRFYQTAIDTVTPLDNLRNMELPENLHVQFEYHRFNPETDTMFKGQTAFNRSSTLVSGLKYKEKYKGHIQNTEWPFNS